METPAGAKGNGGGTAFTTAVIGGIGGGFRVTIGIGGGCTVPAAEDPGDATAAFSSASSLDLNSSISRRIASRSMEDS